MSIVLSQTDIEVVDSMPGLLSLLVNFTNLPVDPPSLYLDLEGIKLGRHGSIIYIYHFALHRPCEEDLPHRRPSPRDAIIPVVSLIILY